MANTEQAGTGECVVVAAFDTIPKFAAALDGLVAGGFRQSEISILGDHQALVDHFGHVPSIDELIERMDTPRESLADESAMREVFRFLSDSLAVVVEIGTAAAAYAVGGPIGVATGATAATQSSLDEFLSDYSDDQLKRHLEENVRDGGIVCWVHAHDRAAAERATAAMETAGGNHLHRIRATRTTFLPID